MKAFKPTAYLVKSERVGFTTTCGCHDAKAALEQLRFSKRLGYKSVVVLDQAGRRVGKKALIGAASRS